MDHVSCKLIKSLMEHDCIHDKFMCHIKTNDAAFQSILTLHCHYTQWDISTAVRDYAFNLRAIENSLQLVIATFNLTKSYHQAKKLSSESPDKVHSQVQTPKIKKSKAHLDFRILYLSSKSQDKVQTPKSKREKAPLDFRILYCHLSTPHHTTPP